MVEEKEVHSTNFDIFRYSGKVYIRPIGRGIVLEDSDDRRQLEEILPDGYYYAEILIKGYTKRTNGVYYFV